MHKLVVIFIIVQLVLLCIMALHDWVHIPPLTDIRELEKHSSWWGRFINSCMLASFILVPLVLTWLYRRDLPLWILWSNSAIYSILTLGTIFSWWVPYVWGSSDAHKAHFAEYRLTHHFLPKRGDNVVPNTFHVLLHILVWTCFALSVYFLVIALKD